MFEDPVHRAVGAIYEAAVDEARWETALDSICETLGASAMGLVVQERDLAGEANRFPYNVNAVSRAYRDFLPTPAGQDYLANLRPLEAPEWAQIAVTPVLRPYLDTASRLSVPDLDRRPDFVALREHVNLRRRMCMRLNENRIWSDTVAIGFPPELEAVPDSVIATFGVMAPHLAKAIQHGRMFSVLRARYRAVLSVIDRVGVGLAIALPSGEVIVENDEAERIFEANDGLARTRAGGLAARAPGVTRKLGALIRDATASEDRRAEGLLSVPRVSGGADYLIEVTPLSDPGEELQRGLDGALVKIIDPDRPPELDVARFAAAYDLTAAEQGVATLIFAGYDTAQIAESRNTTRETVKSQVAAIMRKCGCGNRGALTRLMFRVLPPVR